MKISVSSVIALLLLSPLMSCGKFDQTDVNGADARLASDRGDFNQFHASYPCVTRANPLRNELIFCGDLDLEAERFFDEHLDRSIQRVIITSRGGLERSAINIRLKLDDHEITLIIRDICLSACAHFLFLPHSGRIIVEESSFVAFHETSLALSALSMGKNWFDSNELEHIAYEYSAPALALFRARDLSPYWLTEPYLRLEVDCVAKHPILDSNRPPTIETRKHYDLWIPHKQMVEINTDIALEGFWPSTDSAEASRTALIRIYDEYQLSGKLSFGGSIRFSSDFSSQLAQVPYCEQ